MQNELNKILADAEKAVTTEVEKNDVKLQEVVDNTLLQLNMIEAQDVLGDGFTFTNIYDKNKPETSSSDEAHNKVKMIQQILADLGYDIGKIDDNKDNIDGIYGGPNSKTRASVKLLQALIGIPETAINGSKGQDGLFGNETWGELKKHVNKLKGTDTTAEAPAPAAPAVAEAEKTDAKKAAEAFNGLGIEKGENVHNLKPISIDGDKIKVEVTYKENNEDTVNKVATVIIKNDKKMENADEKNPYPVGLEIQGNKINFNIQKNINSEYEKGREEYSKKVKKFSDMNGKWYDLPIEANDYAKNISKGTDEFKEITTFKDLNAKDVDVNKTKKWIGYVEQGIEKRKTIKLYDEKIEKVNNFYENKDLAEKKQILQQMESNIDNFKDASIPTYKFDEMKKYVLLSIDYNWLRSITTKQINDRIDEINVVISKHTK